MYIVSYRVIATNIHIRSNLTRIYYTAALLVNGMYLCGLLEVLCLRSSLEGFLVGYLLVVLGSWVGSCNALVLHAWTAACR